MMCTAGGSSASSAGDSRFASAWKKVPKGFPSPVSMGTGSRGFKGTGFMGMGLGRVRWVVLFGGLAVEVFLLVGAFLALEVFLGLDVFLVVEVEASPAAQVRLN
jgi:hypothetical protein